LVASSLNYLIYAAKAAREFRAHRCDVVHIHNFSQFVPVVRRIHPSSKIVLHMNCEWLTQFDFKMIDGRLRYADAIFGCSDDVTDQIRKRFPHYASRCATVYNGVDPSQFHAGSNEGIASSIRRIIFVGRISPEKGVHTLLDAFERVVAVRPDARLELVGADWVMPTNYYMDVSEDPAVKELSRFYSCNYGDYLRSRIRGPLTGRVTFTGFLPHSSVVERMRAADLCVLPSVWPEPFGIPSVEGMAMGLPLVATRAGGLKEIVVDGVTGRLVDRADPSALAEAMLAILNDPPLARAMGRAGRERVEQLFSWERIADVVMVHYAKLCAEAPALHHGAQ
jgi:glycosyltransferase involved in cell wall biosynthesis